MDWKLRAPTNEKVINLNLPITTSFKKKKKKQGNVSQCGLAIYIKKKDLKAKEEL